MIALIILANSSSLTTKAEDNINYSYNYDISYLTSEEAGEDVEMTLYNSDYPVEVAEINWICFLDNDWDYTGECITEVMLGNASYNNHTTKGITFLLPENFGTVTGPTGYVEVQLSNGEAYYTPYELENFIYDYPLQFAILGMDAVIYGYDLDTESRIYINNIEITPTLRTSETIYFTMPDSINDHIGTMTIQTKSPYSNKANLYIAPEIFDDPYQTYQSYLIQTDLYETYNDYYNPIEEVVVAVIDSGVDINHEDLQNSIWVNEDEIAGNGEDDDDNGYIDDVYGWTYRLEDAGYLIDPLDSHGTNVAGIIAAEQDNDTGITGMAQNTKIMSLDVFSSLGIDTNYIEQAIYYAANNGADIINLSLGGQAYNSFSTQLNDAIEYAYKKGCLIVVAAGNGNNNNLGSEGINLDNIPGSPICNDGDYDMVLGVAAVDRYGVITEYSNYGSDCIDSSALGEWITSTTWTSEGGYTTDNSGTSFAAPIVSGIAAMIKGHYPNLENWQVQYLIEESGESINYLHDEPYKYNIGALANVKNAFEQAETIEYPSRPEILEEELEETETGLDNTTVEHIFLDVSASHQNIRAIEYLYNEETIIGYTDGTFKPENPVNRAELLKILVEGQGITPTTDEYSNCFPDVADDWYAPYVCYAKEEGWVSGYPDGTFKPANTVNKVEALKMLINSQALDGQLVVSVTEQLFGDTDNSAWYAPYVKLAKDLGILEETDDIFEPDGDMDRGSICENLYRLLMVKINGLSTFGEYEEA